MKIRIYGDIYLYYCSNAFDCTLVVAVVMYEYILSASPHECEHRTSALLYVVTVYVCTRM